MELYHVTTPKKAKRYRESGFIKSPVRGFTTIMAAMAWAIKTGRTVIYQVKGEPAYKLPDHHNSFGEAWWIDGDVPIENISCVFSADKAVEVALSALRPVNRKQVEKVWRSCKVCNGEMTLYQHTNTTKLYMDTFGKAATLVTACNACPPHADCCMKGISANSAFIINYCPECGRPLTDEAVQMVMERLEELHET